MVIGCLLIMLTLVYQCLFRCVLEAGTIGPLFPGVTVSEKEDIGRRLVDPLPFFQEMW